MRQVYTQRLGPVYLLVAFKRREVFVLVGIRFKCMPRFYMHKPVVLAGQEQKQRNSALSVHVTHVKTVANIFEYSSITIYVYLENAEVSEPGFWGCKTVAITLTRLG